MAYGDGAAPVSVPSSQNTKPHHQLRISKMMFYYKTWDALVEATAKRQERRPPITTETERKRRPPHLVRQWHIYFALLYSSVPTDCPNTRTYAGSTHGFDKSEHARSNGGRDGREREKRVAFPRSGHATLDRIWPDTTLPTLRIKGGFGEALVSLCSL